MAVVTKLCGEFRCSKYIGCKGRTLENGWSIKSTCDFIKTQLCTIALALTLFNSVHLPRDAFYYGPVPYLVVYTFWLLAVGLPITLLQLAMGQLSQQDPVGVWRAVPIFRGVGHLKLLTSYLCCIYYMLYVSLSAAYLIWIGKGTFPLRDCTKLFITPNGYENRMNATECFNTTFLAPFTEYPQYLGIMTILIFFLWFFVPILLYRLRKTLKASLSVLAPIVVIIAILLSSFLSKTGVLESMFESCEQWAPLTQPYVWHSALVQALLSTQIVSGYLISAGGTVYRHSDVRWTASFIIMTNIFASWLWVLMWESISSGGTKDSSFISILVLIYQSSVTEKRSKEWPMLALALVLLSGIISVLTLLFPIFDKLQRLTGDHWRLFATAISAAGTALTVGVLARGLEVVIVLDELVVPLLSSFTAIVEVLGFVFIYGWCYLSVDIEFLTGVKLPCFWVGTWCSTPILLIGATGWWLRSLLQLAWGPEIAWPLIGVAAVIAFVMFLMAAIAVVKEEQYNVWAKISSAFTPARLWGPEEPLARYVWMSQRYHNEILSSDNGTTPEVKNYPSIYNIDLEKKFADDWNTNLYHRSKPYSYNDFDNDSRQYVGKPIHQKTMTRGKKVENTEKFRSPNICLARNKLGGPLSCNCNRHFTLHVPHLKSDETTTSL